MSITPIAKEMKANSYIKLPSLYKDIEVLNLINKIFYKAYGNPHEYDYTPEGIKESEESRAEYYIDVDDLVTLERMNYILLDNMFTHIRPFTKAEIYRYSHKRNTPLKIYQMSMEQLKRALFITEHMNMPLSYQVNTMFLENQLPHVHTIKNLKYPFIGLDNEYSK